MPQYTKIHLNYRKEISDYSDLVEILFPGNRNQQHAAVCVLFELKWSESIIHETSCKLTEKRGSFPNWRGSTWDTDFNTPMRNAACTTIAPTGSISIIAKCNGGIEPIFDLAYKRRALDGDEFIQLHPLLEQLGTEQGWMDETVKTMLMAGTNIGDIPGIPKNLAEALVTAHQIAPQWHVRIQACPASTIISLNDNYFFLSVIISFP